MKNILLIALSLISYVGFSQTVKKQPYVFDNYVELNDSLKIGDSSSLKSYGLFLKVDTLANGDYYITPDTAGGVVTTLPYDSITGSPFVAAPIGWLSSARFAIGGVNDTTRASMYFKDGIQRGTYELDPDETTIKGGNGDIFYVNANTVATTISDFSDMDEGREIIVIGLSSGNTTEIATVANRIQITGATDPIVMADNVMITFLVVKDQIGNLYLLEKSRNQ